MSQDESIQKGQWSIEEDDCLRASVALQDESRWDAIAKSAGLKRSGKSCRLRWLNYLRPHLKHGPIGAEEEQIILRLHQRWGNKWARIARRLPGRTDNEIKNYWRDFLRKKTSQLLDKTLQGCSSTMKMKKNNNNMKISLSPWNSDEDESDYNYVIKEISSQGDKSEKAQLQLQDVLMTPQSPYESHFSNWVSLFLVEDYEFMSGGSQRDVIGSSNSDKLWDMDLFKSNSYL